MPDYTPPPSTGGGGSGSSITAGDTSVAITDSGTGHVAVTVDGSEVARFTDDGLLLTDADNGDPVLTIRNTGTGASEPEIRFERTGAGAQSQDIGHIKFFAKDSAGNNHLYANIFADAFDETTNTEDGRIIFEVATGGTDDVEVMRVVGSQGVILNELGNSDQDFRVESDNDANMLVVDAGSDKVGIGIAADSINSTLDIKDGGTFRSTRLLTVNVSSGTTLTEAAHAGRYLLVPTGTVTLPSTSTAGEHYTILNTGLGNITVARNGNTINGASSDLTVATFKGITCIAIGLNAWIALGA